jgi:alanine racemase
MTDGQIDERLATGRLTINLDAIAANWHRLDARAPDAATGAAVKADAYGLGLDRVGPTLFAVGCRHFFCATPAEGVRLRQIIDRDAEIFVLAGLTADSAPFYQEAALTPVLNSRVETEIWAQWCRSSGMRAPCALHVDTGINRLGMELAEAEAFAEENARDHTVTLSLVMSHLACADETSHSMNDEQSLRFRAIAERFAGVRRSLANSAGIFLGPGYHFDITRPGYALYGGEAAPGSDMEQVATLEGRILQLRRAARGETIGYGATQRLERDSLIAIAGAGYADGVLRAASGSGVPMRQLEPVPGGCIAGHNVPVIGRISMDLTAYDVSDVPVVDIEKAKWIEIFGAHCSIDAFARASGTIGYEVLTRLSNRLTRRYLRSGDPGE